MLCIFARTGEHMEGVTHIFPNFGTSKCAGFIFPGQNYQKRVREEEHVIEKKGS